MKKSFFLATLMASFCLTAANAQDETPSNWTHSGLTGLNLSQTSLTNWSEGGENSTTWNVYFNGSLNYKKDKVSWTNDLDANFGQLKTQTIEDWRKNMDNLHFASKFGRQMSEHLFYAALLDFKTQFAPGYSYASDGSKTKVSDLMTPAYLNLSLGFDYKPNDHFSAYYSPAAGKLTYVSDVAFAEAFGLETGENTKLEFGSTFKAAVNYGFFQDKLSVKSDLDLFTAYNDTFGKVDVNWNTLIGLNLSKFVTLTFQSNLKYDDDIKTLNEDGTKTAKVQFKEVLGLGLSCKF